MKVLCINTYAGSLLLAAKKVKADIIGSYEDTGFGSDIQQVNFPNINIIRTYSNWLVQNLSDVIVIAHPPCAQFSGQNNNKKGIEADSFKCTLNVIRYSLENKCKYLCIESVRPAIKFFDEYKKQGNKYGYNVFAIAQNSISFGIPQWRERAWFIFTKEKQFKINFNPVYTPLTSILINSPNSKPLTDFADKQLNKFIKLGINHNDIKILFNTPGLMPLTIKKKLNLKQKLKDINIKYCYPDNHCFLCHSVRVLNPDLWAMTLLKDSEFFCVHPFSAIEYKRLMGFPDSYIFPDKYNRKIREYLSKGTVVNVSEWILKQVINNINDGKKYTYIIKPNQIVDLCPKRKELELILKPKDKQLI